MPRYGIDTTILVRLLTGDPEKEFEQTKAALEKIILAEPASAVEVSNMVIAEAYFVLQHHYSVTKEEARAALISVMTSGLVQAQDGQPVLDALNETRQPGLMDRLIAIDYSSSNRVTLTNDRKMGQLRETRLL